MRIAKNKEILFSAVLVFVLLLILVGIFIFSKNKSAQETTAYEEVEKEEYIEPINPFDYIEIEGQSAFVKNIQTGDILYSKKPTKVLPLASLTKIMTVLTAYETLEPNSQITITIEDLASDGESFLYPGETFYMKDLANLTLVGSSNDGASALAFAGNKALKGSPLAQNSPYSKAKFIDHMNILAGKIGLENTTISNETGLDESLIQPGAVGSAKDVTELTAYILNKNPEIIEETKNDSFFTASIQGLHHTLYNTNEIVNRLPNILASKTGYTDIAGGNLMVVIDPGLNTPVIITVLGSSKEGRFEDVEKLAEATLVYFSQAELKE